MNKLKSSYIKRAVLYPLLILAILIFLATILVPRLIAQLPVGTDKTHAVVEYNPEDYDLFVRDYKNFDDLNHNRFVGWLSSENVALGCAVTYDSEKEDSKASALLKGSTEPWNDGCMMIIGKNTDNEFRNLHKAKIGDTVDVELYNNGKYTYKISSIEYIVSRKEIADYKKKNSLLMCLPYKNFKTNGNFYTVYVADLVKK